MKNKKFLMAVIVLVAFFCLLLLMVTFLDVELGGLGKLKIRRPAAPPTTTVEVASRAVNQLSAVSAQIRGLSGWPGVIDALCERTSDPVRCENVLNIAVQGRDSLNTSLQNVRSDLASDLIAIAVELSNYSSEDLDSSSWDEIVRLVSDLLEVEDINFEDFCSMRIFVDVCGSGEFLSLIADLRNINQAQAAEAPRLMHRLAGFLKKVEGMVFLEKELLKSRRETDYIGYIELDRLYRDLKEINIAINADIENMDSRSGLIGRLAALRDILNSLSEVSDMEILQYLKAGDYAMQNEAFIDLYAPVAQMHGTDVSFYASLANVPEGGDITDLIILTKGIKGANPVKIEVLNEEFEFAKFSESIDFAKSHVKNANERVSRYFNGEISYEELMQGEVDPRTRTSQSGANEEIKKIFIHHALIFQEFCNVFLEGRCGSSREEIVDIFARNLRPTRTVEDLAEDIVNAICSDEICRGVFERVFISGTVGGSEALLRYVLSGVSNDREQKVRRWIGSILQFWGTVPDYPDMKQFLQDVWQLSKSNDEFRGTEEKMDYLEFCEDAQLNDIFSQMNIPDERSECFAEALGKAGVLIEVLNSDSSILDYIKSTRDLEIADIEAIDIGPNDGEINDDDVRELEDLYNRVIEDLMVDVGNEYLSFEIINSRCLSGKREMFYDYYYWDDSAGGGEHNVCTVKTNLAEVILSQRDDDGDIYGGLRRLINTRREKGLFDGYRISYNEAVSEAEKETFYRMVQSSSDSLKGYMSQFLSVLPSLVAYGQSMAINLTLPELERKLYSIDLDGSDYLARIEYLKEYEGMTGLDNIRDMIVHELKPMVVAIADEDPSLFHQTAEAVDTVFATSFYIPTDGEIATMWKNYLTLLSRVYEVVEKGEEIEGMWEGTVGRDS